MSFRKLTFLCTFMGVGCAVAFITVSWFFDQLTWSSACACVVGSVLIGTPCAIFLAWSATGLWRRFSRNKVMRNNNDEAS